MVPAPWKLAVAPRNPDRLFGEVRPIPIGNGAREALHARRVNHERRAAHVVVERERSEDYRKDRDGECQRSFPRQRHCGDNTAQDSRGFRQRGP